MLNSLRTTHPFWQTAFRPFFLLGSGFSALLMGTWGLYLSGLIQINPYGGHIIWHSHEMLFGFTLAIAVGFLLTAVQNWTGQLSAKGKPLKVLVALWFTARVLWLWPDVPSLLLATLDILFPLYAAHWLARPMLRVEPRSKQKHNWPFVGVLILLACMQGVYHGLIYMAPDVITLLNKAAVLVMANLVLWIGGRVLPFFIESRLQVKRRPLPKLLTPIAMLSSWLLVPLVIFNLDSLTTIVAGIAALSHSLRLLLFWRNNVLHEALLWSLFLASGWVVIGLFSIAFQSNAWVHIITVGGLGGMILSIMSRVSLGHTGEPIRTLKFIPFALLCISVAALLRSFSVDLSALSINSYSISAAFWLIGFTVFLVHYFPKLTKARRDGLPR